MDNSFSLLCKYVLLLNIDIYYHLSISICLVFNLTSRIVSKINHVLCTSISNIRDTYYLMRRGHLTRPRSPVDSPHKGQWHAALTFSLIYPWTNGWANNRDADDLRRHRAHYDVTVMILPSKCTSMCHTWARIEFDEIITRPIPAPFSYIVAKRLDDYYIPGEWHIMRWRLPIMISIPIINAVLS